MSKYFTTLLCMLLTASMMWPSEGAINGSGLQIAVLWLIAALIGIWSQVSGGKHHKRFNIPAGAWLLLVVGFWLSTWAVFLAEGDRRAALNLCFEWTAVGVAWCFVSRIAAESRVRHVIVLTLVGLCFGAAIQGIVQHHMTYAAQAEWYKQSRTTLDAAALTNDFHASKAARQVAAEFKAMDIPLSGAGRELFEGRLLSSSEPTGPFALTNTLSGLLAMSLVIVVGVGVEQSQKIKRIPWGYLLRTLPFFFTIAYCLVLTKSRTAWIALAAGVFILLIGRGLSSRFVLRFVLGTVLVLVAVVSIGIGTGALDKEVVLESPRSLQFRLLYWIGASGVIREKPVFGAGPGNFRQTYLAHKPIESSEEILDPHNIFLDAWCSAGILGFIGVCLLSWQLIRGAIGRTSGDDYPAELPGSLSFGWPKVAVTGILSGAFLHLFWRWLGGGQFWDSAASSFASSQNIVLLVPVGAFTLFMLLFRSISPSAKVISTAGVTLFVHLLGAGGLQITVIGLALAVVSGCVSPLSLDNSEQQPRGLKVQFSRVVASCIIFCGLWAAVSYGLLPVQRAEWHARTSVSLENRGSLAAAVAQLQSGIVSDPLSVSLRQRRAQLLTYELTRASLAHAPSGKAAQVFSNVLAAADDFIDADRRNWTGYIVRGEARRIAAQAEIDNGQLDLALADVEQAIRLYPTNAHLWVTLAELADIAGNEILVRDAVNRALAIDDSSRNWGHVDRYLGEETLRWLDGKK